MRDFFIECPTGEQGMLNNEVGPVIHFFSDRHYIESREVFDRTSLLNIPCSPVGHSKASKPFHLLPSTNENIILECRQKQRGLR
jgi:hypothetical protein